MAKNTDYTAEKIQVLEGLEPVRKRPGMYIGSTDERGYHESIREIIDNSVDESFAGKAQDIWVFIEKDNTVVVRDNGRGIPVDKHSSGVSALEVAMTKLHAGGKFSGDAYKVSGGLHGVGASVVNALSSYFQVIVLRDGKAYTQEYSAGKPKKQVHEIEQSELDKLVPSKWQVKINKSETGTTVGCINTVYITTDVFVISVCILDGDFDIHHAFFFGNIDDVRKGDFVAVCMLYLGFNTAFEIIIGFGTISVVGKMKRKAGDKVGSVFKKT